MKRILISILVMFMANVLVAQNYQNVKVNFEKTGDGLYEFYAENPNFYPMQISLSFTELINMSTTCKLPYVSTIRHGKTFLFKVKRTLLDIPGGFKHTFITRVGGFPVNYDPNTIYSLPIAKGKQTNVFTFDVSKSDDPTKIMWAFTMGKGDTVYSCRDGIVGMKTETTYQGGFRTGENSVTIVHPDNSFAKYEVFADSMIFVGIGDSVKAGSALGLAGGESYQVGAHARLSVFYVNARIDSIVDNKIKNYHTWIDPLFKTESSEPFYLKKGEMYLNN